jgi:hypothetical protein
MVAACWRQRLSSYFATCLFWFCAILAAQVAVETWRNSRRPEVSVQTIRGYVLRLQDANTYAPESAFVSFDLQADFRPVWSGSTKQLYVFLAAEAENASSRVILWDQTIGSFDEAVLDLSNHRAKYVLRAFPNEKLRGNPMTLRLHYMVMPYIGYYQTRAARGSAQLLIAES